MRCLFLRKTQAKIGNITLTEFFADSNFPDKDLKELANILTYYKNTELEPLSVGGTTIMDIIDYIYENGYSEHVIKYNW